LLLRKRILFCERFYQEHDNDGDDQHRETEGLYKHRGAEVITRGIQQIINCLENNILR
jgi:hypothetical protein